MRSAALLIALLAIGCGGAESGPDGAGGPGGSSIDGENVDPENKGDPGENVGPEPETAAGACAADNQGLVFDGKGDRVHMGAAEATLGLKTFTLEAWVRRDGSGRVVRSGEKGRAIVPVVARGRDEAEGAQKNCNYLFGFSGEVLAAEFEDGSAHDEHKVAGSTPVTRGEWHHVAASYDGNVLRVYLDGQLDGQHAVGGAVPSFASNQHFGLGAAFDSAGQPGGALDGALDEVRVWDHARTEAEIAANVYKTVTSGTGLVARWALDGNAQDSVGNVHGTVGGDPAYKKGVVLDGGRPPVATEAMPDDGAAIAKAASKKLTQKLSDADGDAVKVEFFTRPVTKGADFTIVVLPDTQNYTKKGAHDEKFFEAQTQWVRKHRDAYNIVGVIHNGDIINNDDQPYQWKVANKAMATLEEPMKGLPDGMPYGLGVGNHDQMPRGHANGTGNFNKWFGVGRYVDRAYYGGHYDFDNDENFVTFVAGGMEIVVVNLQYRSKAAPAPTQWARSVFESHPDAFGILNSHFILNKDAKLGAFGKSLWAELHDVDNLQLMTNGHIHGEARRKLVAGNGNVVHAMLADYQGRAHGGNGYMRIWEFSPKNDTLSVRTYSPQLDKWEHDGNSEFTIHVDLHGSGSKFTKLATVDAATATASATLTGLQPGRSYEWYARLDDCNFVVKTPVRRFKVKEK